ncbi:kyphoscoliosis peptidase isoform X3 [Leucoraja erinacea]|uniref:kyphoscoliosis peptidase isoform X3 n=1 Tax=Leucoraja erinaceus TaxID=7782 RepID=UPI0024589DA0|nr:kyphoscoliosis peptidase isoform X3 [Leucoraja erinacea]
MLEVPGNGSQDPAMLLSVVTTSPRCRCSSRSNTPEHQTAIPEQTAKEKMAESSGFDRFVKLIAAIICLPFLPLWFCFVYVQRLLEAPGNETPEAENTTSEEESGIDHRNARPRDYARPSRKPQEYRADKSGYPVLTGRQGRQTSTSLYSTSSEASDSDDESNTETSDREADRYPQKEKHVDRSRRRDPTRDTQPQAAENAIWPERGTPSRRTEPAPRPKPRGTHPRRTETSPSTGRRGQQPQRVENIPRPAERGKQPSRKETPDAAKPIGKHSKKKPQASAFDESDQKGEDVFTPEDEGVSEQVNKADKQRSPSNEENKSFKSEDAGSKSDKVSEPSLESKDKKDVASGQKYKLKEIKDDMYNLKSMKMNVAEFEALDVYACKVPPMDSVEALVQNLLQYASTDLEKIRAIWMWICCHIEYDVKGYHNKDHLHSDACDVLKSGKAVCAGYSGLFCEMCSFADIQCTEIAGYSKGYNYEVGKKFKGDSDHAWNAVFLEGKWHLLDSTWGAGHVNETCTKFTHKYVEFYFFTHPTLFINNHFPMEEKWQLISPRISLKIFENMVFRTGDFFEMGLKYIHPDVQVISTVNGRVIINIEGRSPTLFMYNLDDRKDCAIIILTKYGMKLEVLPQKVGNHKLKIYAKLWDSEEETYSFICAYLVRCDLIDENFKLPKSFHNPMGPSWLTETKGLLQPSHPEPLIYCEDGRCAIRFMVNMELSFASKLSGDDVRLSDEVMKSHVFKTQSGNWVEFKIQLPQSGLYVFAIFAKEKNSRSPTHDHICEYLISCTNKNVHLSSFPKIFSSWTDGCELVEPLSGTLPPNQLIKFKFKIPHVRNVQVYGKGACPLTMTQEGYWEGICNTEDNKHLNVGVSDKMFDSKFTFALQYEVGGLK